MNYLDIIFCIPLLWGLYKGFAKGLIVEAATIVAFGLGVWGGIHFSDYFALQLTEWFKWENEYMPVISFSIVFLGIIAAVFLVAKWIQKLTEKMALGFLNKLGGACFGVLKFAMIISVVIFIIDAIEKSYPMVSFETKEKSLLYEPMSKVAPLLIPALHKSDVAALMPQAGDINIGINTGLLQEEEE